MNDRATFAAELAAELTDEVNSDAVQEFLEAKGIDYDHTDVDQITLLVEQDPVYKARPFLAQCGSCDAGLPMGCTCPTGDYRSAMARLVDEVVRLRAEAATQSGDPDADDVTLADEPRCTLESSMSGTCYCTGRPGCQGGGDDD